MNEITERVDHVAEAKTALVAAYRARLPYDSEETQYVGALLADAQAHATLALVEQQRLANLIALASAPDGYLNPAAIAALRALLLETDPVTHGERWLGVRPEIAAALGITP